MADKKTGGAAPAGGNDKSSGKNAPGGPDVDPVRNARERGEDPSPDDRRRGERAINDPR